MPIELKIKSKHLSVEAQLIRFEERKLLKQFRWNIEQHNAAGSNIEYNQYEDPMYSKYYSLNRHRRKDVRQENRATYLARAYIAGVLYTTVEHKRKQDSEYDFFQFVIPRVVAMVNKYRDKSNPEVSKETLVNWSKLEK